MRKKIKKAFTLVELLVVIAILAILATVSIVGYNSFTKKAKVSNDTVLVKQMNDVLFANQQTDDKNNTMTEALKDVFGAGYDVEKLTPTTTNYNIVWDSENDQMVLLDDSKNVVYPTEKVTSKDKMFLITKTAKDFSDTKDEFAHYLTSEFTYDGALAITTGLDAGSNTNVNDISYTGGETGKTISIRTNGGKLVVNGPKDTINHYGAADYTNIVAVYGESYHEFGVSAYARIASGHFVAENTAKVVNLNVASSDVKITENTGAKVNEYSKDSSDVVIKVNNAEKAVDKVLNESKFENESKNSSVVAEGGVVEVNGINYSTLKAAVYSSAENSTIKLTADNIVTEEIIIKKNLIIDFNGFKLSNSVDLWFEDPNKVHSVVALLSIDGSNVKLVDSSVNKAGGVYAKQDDCYGINILNNANVVIESGNYIGNISAVQVEEGTLTIKGGYFDIIQKYPTKSDPTGYFYEINCIDENYKNEVARVSIEGGTFVGFNPSKDFEITETKIYLANGYTVKSVSHPTVEKIYIYTVEKNNI